MYSRYTWVIVLVLVLMTNGMAVNKDGSTRIGGRSLLGTRQTISGGTVSDRLGAYDEETDSYDWAAYGVYVGERFAVCLLLGIFSVVAIPCFLICRCCCNSCGGRKPSYGLFCVKKRKGGNKNKSKNKGNRPPPAKPWVEPGREDDESGESGEGGEDGIPKRYSSRVAFVFRVLSVILICGLALGGVVVFVGNDKVSKGITELVDSVIGTAEEVVRDVEGIVDQLTSLPYTPNARANTASAISEAQSTLADARKAGNDQVETIDRYRFYALVACFSLPLIFAVIGLGLGLARITLAPLSVCLSMLVLLTLLILWLSVGLHVVFFIVFGDVCTEIDIQLDPAQNNGTSLLGDFIGCGKDNDQFSSLVSESQQGITSAADATCVRVTSICGRPESDPCPDLSSCGVDNVLSYREHRITDSATPGTSITWATCPSLCNTPALIQETSSFVNESNILIAYQGIMVDSESIVECDFVDRMVARFKSALCSLFVEGVELAIAGQIIVALAAYGSVFVIIMGYKRLNSKYGKASGVGVAAVAGAGAGGVVMHGGTMTTSFGGGGGGFSYSDSDTDPYGSYDDYDGSGGRLPPPYAATGGGGGGGGGKGGGRRDSVLPPLPGNGKRGGGGGGGKSTPSPYGGRTYDTDW